MTAGPLARRFRGCAHRRRSWGCSRAPRCSAPRAAATTAPRPPRTRAGHWSSTSAEAGSPASRSGSRCGDDGTASLTVGNVDPQQSEFDLADSELERLTAELEAAEFDEVGSDGPDACADCFIDRITYEGESTTILPEVDDVPDSVGAVLTELRGLVESA